MNQLEIYTVNFIVTNLLVNGLLTARGYSVRKEKAAINSEYTSVVVVETDDSVYRAFIKGTVIVGYRAIVYGNKTHYFRNEYIRDLVKEVVESNKELV